MFSKILDCPECKFRFQYDYENELPEIITCPSCKNSTSAENYAALIFCPECRAKLKIPLTIINDPDNICPQCGCNLKAATLLEENKFTATFADNNEDIHQLYKRMLQDGEIFDKYEIIRLLGKGGMAEVYLAKHRLLNQQCALKLMRCGMESENPVFIKRFLREAKLLYQIDHPNIVKVFDVGSDFTSGHLFIAMEYIAGMTLHEKLRQGLYSEDELKNVAVTMAHALQALADAHVVHRDIKPSNIMLTSSGELKLMDLGIAKFSNSQAGEMTLTMEQSTIGTPNYASPEQCRSAHNTDIRSDIYSLGASLYHLASGKLPFDGHTPMETILQVLQKEAVPLKNFRPDLSRKMLNVIEAMMQKNPDDRPANPDQLLALLYGNNRKFPAIKRFNPLKWFKKDTPGAAPAPRKLLPAAVKVLISAALLGLIALNVNYIIKKVKHNQRVRAQQQTAQKPHRAPSASGIQNQQARSRQRTASSISRPATATSNYRPTVVFKSFTPQQQIAHWEFDQALQAKDGSFFNIQDGIMYARGSRSKTSAEHLKYLPLDLPENCQELTVSMDLKVQHGNGYIVKLQPDLIIGKYDNTLMLICAAASHRFSFPFMNDVPIDKWFNLTISCDKAQRELKIFSGNRLLRKVRISPRASNVITQVGFFEAAPLEICNTAVERITVFNSCISEEKVTRERKAVIAAVERIPAAEITKTVAPAPSAATPVDKEDAEQKKNVAANSEFRIFTEFDQAQKAAAAEQKNLLVIWDNRSIPIHVEQITMLLDKYPSLKSRIPQKFITVFLNSPPGSPQTAQLQNIIQRNSHFRPGNAEKKLLSCLTITPAGKIVHELRTTGSLSATIFYQALDWAMYYKSGANNLARSRPRPIPQVNINFSSWQLSAINKDYLVNYPAALQMAEQKKLPILVLFTQTGHTGSEKLLERIKSNQAFQEYLSKNFVVLHIALVNDADNTFSAAQKLHNAQLALRSSINSPDRLPAFTICNFQGTILYTRSHITTNTGLLERHLRKHLPSIRQSTDFITGNRTVAKRLQEVSYKLKMIRKSTGTLKNDDFYTGCVKYLNQQINVLKQQMQYQQL